MTDTPTTTFAGFAYPRAMYTPPTGTLVQRLAKRRENVAQYGRPSLTGGYFQHGPAVLTSRKDASRMFYLDERGTGGDFQPGLRWKWCDEVGETRYRIGHQGWYTDDYLSDKIRGMVFRLNHGRGFLIGWSMGEGMISTIEYGTIYADERTAAYAADDLADNAAREEREAAEECAEEQRLADEAAEAEQDMRDAVDAQLIQAGWLPA